MTNGRLRKGPMQFAIVNCQLSIVNFPQMRDITANARRPLDGLPVLRRTRTADARPGPASARRGAEPLSVLRRARPGPGLPGPSQSRRLRSEGTRLQHAALFRLRPRGHRRVATLESGPALLQRLQAR